MKRSRFSESQVVGILKEGEAGKQVVDIFGNDTMTIIEVNV